MAVMDTNKVIESESRNLAENISHSYKDKTIEETSINMTTNSDDISNRMHLIYLGSSSKLQF